MEIIDLLKLSLKIGMARAIAKYETEVEKEKPVGVKPKKIKKAGD